MLQKLKELNLNPNSKVKIYDDDEELFVGEFKNATKFYECKVVTSFDNGIYTEIFIPRYRPITKKIKVGDEDVNVIINKKEAFLKVLEKKIEKIKKDIREGLSLRAINEKYFKELDISNQHFSRCVSESSLKDYFKEKHPNVRDLFLLVLNKNKKEIEDMIDDGKTFIDIYNKYFSGCINIGTYQSYLQRFAKDLVEKRNNHPRCKEFILSNLKKMQYFSTKRAFFRYVSKQTGYSMSSVAGCYFLCIGKGR